MDRSHRLGQLIVGLVASALAWSAGCSDGSLSNGAGGAGAGGGASSSAGGQGQGGGGGHGGAGQGGAGQGGAGQGGNSQGGNGQGGGGTTPACVHFAPGHYLREVDSAARSIDGLQNISFDLGAQGPDLSDFTGIVLQIDWAMLEPQQGVYDFSRVDQILALVKSKGLHLRFKIMDRSFWDPCNTPVPVVPPYVQQVPNVNGGKGCFADIWTKATMDGYIALHIAAAKHFDADPAFAGFNTEETAMAVPNGVQLSQPVYDQRVRLAQELFAAVPQALLISEFNWPINNDLAVFTAMVDASVVPGNGGPKNAMGVSWPDTWLNPSAYTAAELPSVLPKIECTENASTNGRVPCTWYNLARQNQHRTIVAPNVEGGVLTGTLAEAEALYQDLDLDIGAHMITWDGWTGPEPDYLRKVVIPTLKNHGGKLSNKTCPFEGH
jgi:hypothetical protein